MHSAIHRNLDRTKLRIGIALFFICLTVPTVVLVKKTYNQLQWEAFHRHWVMAEELTARIDESFLALVNREEQRSFTDYSFLVVSGDTEANFLQRSPLAEFPPGGDFPGLVGYFQIDAQGRFSTPLVPPDANAASYGISNEQLEQRLALQNRIQQVLAQNRLMQTRPQPTIAAKPALAEPQSWSAAGQRQFERQSITGDAGTASMPTAEIDAVPEEADDSFDFDAAEIEAAQEIPAQAAFDRLGSLQTKSKTDYESAPPGNLGRVEELRLDEGYQQKLSREQTGKKESIPEKKTGNQDAVVQIDKLLKNTPAVARSRVTRNELRIAPGEAQASSPATRFSDRLVQSDSKIEIFASEIDPFEFSLLESGHLVLFRKVWRDNQRYIQGILIEQQPFMRELIEDAFLSTTLSNMSDLAVAWQGNVITALSNQNSYKYLSSAAQLQGSLLYQAGLSAPFDKLQLIYSINELPAGPGATVINWLVFIMFLVLCVGLWLMYRLGSKQIALVQQQQDFVSSVSHELKTPLTSIRMYGEMLREGWADESRKKSYYEFIHDESERLSRLISNVLQLARMTRNDLHIDLKSISVGELMDIVRSKITSQVERAGFGLSIQCAEDIRETVLHLDADFFSQILINLIDNAIKFSVKAEQKSIEMEVRQPVAGEVVFSVRDYGPGIPKNQIRKIFQLFYRSESELTRETVGTGIGLALVHKLMLVMRGRIDVINREPGVEFRLIFPVSQ